MATRRTQPYRKGRQKPGLALEAMKRGRTFHDHNPQDARRDFESLRRRRRPSRLHAAIRKRMSGQRTTVRANG